MPNIRTTPSILEIDYNSRLVPLVCGAAAILALGIAVFVAEGFISTAIAGFAGCFCAFIALLFSEQSSLRVDFEANRIHYTWRGFRQTPVSQDIPLSDLRGIRTEYNVAGPRHQSTYRACLVTANQTIPLTRMFSSTSQNDGPTIHRLLTEKGLELSFDEKVFDIDSYRRLQP